MKKLMNKIKKRMKTKASDDEVIENEYLELNTESSFDRSSKVIVRPFTIEDFSDLKPILDSLREGYTVALVNIKPLREKDIVELKRAINKLKKTTDAIEGEIAGFGDDYIVVTPSFATIYRSSQTEKVGGTDIE
ncbi:cell division protein SepF [Candidatus Woesearchaeota archaeon]|nr:cell division protein SepF [Candidatus Woesearchaeota archaeon]